jgi:hypothetical protein
VGGLAPELVPQRAWRIQIPERHPESLSKLRYRLYTRASQLPTNRSSGPPESSLARRASLRRGQEYTIQALRLLASPFPSAQTILLPRRISVPSLYYRVHWQHREAIQEHGKAERLESLARRRSLRSISDGTVPKYIHAWQENMSESLVAQQMSTIDDSRVRPSICYYSI